jgi:hypothetical protein
MDLGCHECTCHLAPPCSACAACKHWDVQEYSCDNECHDCNVDHQNGE